MFLYAVIGRQRTLIAGRILSAPVHMLSSSIEHQTLIDHSRALRKPMGGC